MPAGDRTGPSGMGPMTGRGMGYCAGNEAPGYASPAPGRGGGLGRRGGFRRGGGFGLGNMFHATGLPGRTGWGSPCGYGDPYNTGAQLVDSSESELDFLKREAMALKQRLEQVQERMDRLEAASEK